MKSNDYWYWDKEISHEVCHKIIKLGEGKWDQAKTWGSKDENIEHDLNKTRKSDIAWITEQWVYDLIWPYMLNANEKGGWKYDIVAAESCQVTRYTKDGFYTWHIDGMGSHEEVIDGNVRKLSITIVLNSDFEGGDFEMGSYNKELFNIPRLEEGSIIVFPSFMEHRVAPVTKGNRYSLVAWFLGPPFR